MEQTLINSNNNESNYNNGNQGYSSSSTLDNQFQGSSSKPTKSIIYDAT